MLRLLLRGVPALAALALMACAQTLPVQPAYERPVIRVNNQESARPIQFQRIVIKMQRGAKIGELQEGLMCAPFDTLVYQGGRVVLDDEEFTDAFRHELQSANYRVVGDPNALFDDGSAWQAEYLVAGVIKRIQANICYGGWSWDDPLSRGEAFMEVDWQVYSRLDRQVAFATTTQGSSRITESRRGADNDLFVLAFAQATRNLLADRKFHDLVAGEESPAAQAEAATVQLPEAAIPMPRTKAFAGSIAKNSERVRQGVVTILVAAGHGSGFFIDDAGHLLTNAHVVRGTDRAKVVLAGGLEATGNVLARDPRRDVALLKVDLGKTTALPLRAVKPAVGAEVYAMGSPFDPSLSATLSKGIVSAYRTMEGLDFIQSDVNVMGGSSGGPLLDTSGNVIGMTVSGVATGDLPMGLNYFIPIGDALLAVGIGSSVQKQREATASVLPSDTAGVVGQPKPQIGSLALAESPPGSPAEARQSIVGIVTERGVGAGFFIDRNGHILTNAHLLGDSIAVNVRFATGQSAGAKIIARADQLDLALVRVDEAPAHGLLLELKPIRGDTQIYIFGSPFAPGSGVDATRGIVRGIRNQAGYSFIQTDIKGMPDYGGGPLLDSQNRVVGIATTGRAFDKLPLGADTFLSIADALRALGIGEGVRTAAKPVVAESVNSTPATSAAAQTTTKLAQTSISSLSLFDTGLQQNMPNIRASLAAVSVGTASGRGFFIDTKGHLLTNAHAVGSAKEVHVRLNSGGEYRGSVTAVNPRLDLALVKVAETGGIGLPLQFIKPKLGTPVYAVGTVDGDDTSIVRNRGVVVYRTMDDMEVVKTVMSAQPAVAGTPLLDDMGNALGIAVAGLFPNEPGDVSFFITIADALRALGVGVAS